MTEPIISRDLIAQQAAEAAATAFRTDTPQANPYPVGSEAHAVWKAAYERYLLWHSSPESEGSA